MFASYLYTLCQALDLRAMNMRFKDVVKILIEDLNIIAFDDIFLPVDLKTLNHAIWAGFEIALDATTARDSSVGILLHVLINTDCTGSFHLHS